MASNQARLVPGVLHGVLLKVMKPKSKMWLQVNLTKPNVKPN